jgi:hypothetical protein
MKISATTDFNCYSRSLAPRLGHASLEAVNQLENTVAGAGVTPSEHPICETCKLSNARQQISRRPAERAATAFEKDYFDLIHEETAFNVHKWVCHYICSYSGWHQVYTANTKTGRKPANRSRCWGGAQFNRETKVFFSDGEKTLRIAYSDWFKKKGIEWDQSVRYTPSQNGRAERAGGILTLRARSFSIPLDLWPEAYSTTAYILNRTPTREGNAWTTPFQKVYDKQLMLSNL